MIPLPDTVTISKELDSWTVPAHVSYTSVGLTSGTGTYYEFVSELRALIEPLPVADGWLQNFTGGWLVEWAGVTYRWNEPPQVRHVDGVPHHWTIALVRTTAG